MIEGPPGTGKTQTILNLIANLLYRGKTIAVLSNNNAAAHNVYEKLSKYNLTPLCATLGNKENKEKFIAKQNPQFPNTHKNPTSQNLDTKTTKQTIQKSHQKLQEIFTLQNAIATAQAQLEALQLEYKYFKAFKSESLEFSPESTLIKNPKTRTLFAKPTPHTILMLKVLLEEDSKEKLSLWLKLKAMYHYGIGDFRFSL